MLSLTAEQLRKTRPGERDIIRYVSQQLSEIEHAIRAIHATRGVRYKHALPLNFMIENMSNRDAQVRIYSRIIEELKNSGFVVRFHRGKDACFLEIEWEQYDDSALDRRSLSIINSVIVGKHIK